MNTYTLEVRGYGSFTVEAHSKQEALQVGRKYLNDTNIDVNSLRVLKKVKQ